MVMSGSLSKTGFCSMGMGGYRSDDYDYETEEERIERERLAAIKAEHERILRLIPVLTQLRHDRSSWLGVLPPQLLDKVLEFLGWSGSKDVAISGLRMLGSAYDSDSIAQLFHEIKLRMRQCEIQQVRGGITSACLLVEEKGNVKFPRRYFVKLPPSDKVALDRGLNSSCYLVESLFYGHIRPILTRTAHGHVSLPSTGVPKWHSILPEVYANHYDYAYNDFVLVLQAVDDRTGWSWGNLTDDQQGRHPLYALSIAASLLAKVHTTCSAQVEAADPLFAALARRPFAPAGDSLVRHYSTHCSASLDFLKTLGVRLPRQLVSLCLKLADPACSALKHFVDSEEQNRLPAALCHGDLNPGNIAVRDRHELPTHPWLDERNLEFLTTWNAVLAPEHQNSSTALAHLFEDMESYSRVQIADWQFAHLGPALRDISKLIALNCPEEVSCAVLCPVLLF